MHAFLKEPACTKSETLKIVSARKSARLLLRKDANPESNFILTVTYPGSLLLDLYRDQEVLKER